MNPPARIAAVPGTPPLPPAEAERDALRVLNEQLVAKTIRLEAEIAARQRAEEALRDKEAILAQAVELAHLGAWSITLVDSENFMANPVQWSGQMYRILGYAPAEAKPSIKAFVARVHPDDRKPLLDSMRRAMAEKRPHSWEYRLLRPDGSERIVWERGEFCYDAQGHPTHFTGAIQDITARKLAKRELREHRDRLEALVAERTADLLAANKELQGFTYAASHDLKAPLGRINSFSALLERSYRERLEGDGLLFLGFIRQNAKRMTDLIDDLLAHAQIEQKTLAVQSVDVAGAVRLVLKEKEDDIRDAGAEIRLDLPSVMVRANPHALAQVLRNLLENALKYAGKACPPRVEIGAQAAGGRCRLWLRDNGIGFDMAYHERIFEIFRRLHTYDEYPGSGVGLALVRKAMERMGGKVWAESVPGAGATFFVELPAA